MLYLPPLRRLLLPSIFCLIFILFYRSKHGLSSNLSQFIVVQPDLTPPGERIPIQELETRHMRYQNPEDNYKSPNVELYYDYEQPMKEEEENAPEHKPYWSRPAENPYMTPLYECAYKPNPHTNHIRLPYYIRNVSMVYKGETDNEKHRFLNPAIISLPFWADSQYLLVGRVHTDGSYMENLICEANICYSPDGDEPREGEKACTQIDLDLLGGTAGLRCTMAPITINVPPTPAEKCEGSMAFLMDIPGFHDPRIFWSERGEPLMMMNSQSRYACFGLWVIDLRKEYFPLEGLLSKNPWASDFGPLMSYPSLTEITRNPPSSRGNIEKNWMFFSTRSFGTYVHYDMGPSKRSFAKLLGSGLSTVNLTDPFEQPCLESVGADPSMASWHQGTNSLRLILCERNNRNKQECKPNGDNEVFFALIHHKHKGPYGLPIRYERYFMVWSALPPFSMLGISKHPILLMNETAHPWSPAENWEDDEEQQKLVEQGKQGKEMWATFTYTVSLAYGWRKGDQPQDKNVGYLDDDVVMGIGVDDWAMVYSRVPAKELLTCLRACPGRAPNPLTKEEMAKFSPDPVEYHPDEEEVVISVDEDGNEVVEDKPSEEDKPPEGEGEKREDGETEKKEEDDGNKSTEEKDDKPAEEKDDRPPEGDGEKKEGDGDKPAEEGEKKEDQPPPATEEDKKDEPKEAIKDEAPTKDEKKSEAAETGKTKLAEKPEDSPAKDEAPSKDKPAGAKPPPPENAQAGRRRPPPPAANKPVDTKPGRAHPPAEKDEPRDAPPAGTDKKPAAKEGATDKKPAEKPLGKAADKKPAEKPADKLAEKSTDTPVDKAEDKPADKPEDKPAEPEARAEEPQTDEPNKEATSPPKPAEEKPPT